ncbi:MAG: AAA family ATPase [Fibromonadales bacterium]|nr:AAA family ATPase [Fibromonadales bacterium]
MENLRIVLVEYLKTKYNVSDVVMQCADEVLKQLERGSVCIEISDAEKRDALKKSSAVGIGDEANPLPLVFENGNLYIQRYFEYQKIILNRLEKLLKNKKLHIITGGPGTGKTTNLANILRDRLSEKILLAAPTGKAAKRMEESLCSQKINLESKTIHRLLGYKHLSASFKHTEKEPLNANIIAIDECSMVDLPMMAKLLSAVPKTCDLYLLGDKNQLASVEVGSVFADICEKYKEYQNDETVYTELKKNHRAKEAPGIVALSKDILEGTIKDFNYENIHYSETYEFFSWYENLFNAKSYEEALEFLKTFQILCATKAGKHGTRHINYKLCEQAKKKRAKFTPIIITENSYQLDLFNGDVGVKDDEFAYFSKEKIKPVLTLPEHEAAFAITIHKSQGSEYERVAVVYPDRKIEKTEENKEDEKIFLTKELLYTAITRAKKECFIFGSKEVLLDSCKYPITRASGIK